MAVKKAIEVKGNTRNFFREPLSKDLKKLVLEA